MNSSFSRPTYVLPTYGSNVGFTGMGFQPPKRIAQREMHQSRRADLCFCHNYANEFRIGTN